MCIRHSPSPELRIGGREATVAVFITCYGEPLEVIRRTALAARDLRGQHSVSYTHLDVYKRQALYGANRVAIT